MPVHNLSGLKKLLHVSNTERILASTQQAVETWLNIEDISRIEISCHRTPAVRIYLRSSPKDEISAKGKQAEKIIAALRAGAE